MTTPKVLSREWGIEPREVRIAAETLGLGTWTSNRLILTRDEVEQLRPVLDRIVAERRSRSAEASGSAAPSLSA